jgi:hypothetical protein
MPGKDTKRSNSDDDTPDTTPVKKARAANTVSQITTLIDSSPDFCPPLALMPIVVLTEAKGRKPWTIEEEGNFMAAVDAVVKKHLWNEVKDTALAERGANGIRSHWDAIVSL